MQRTRRGLPGAGVAVATGFAGCLGVDGVQYPDATSQTPPDADESSIEQVDDTTDTPGAVGPNGSGLVITNIEVRSVSDARCGLRVRSRPRHLP